MFDYLTDTRTYAQQQMDAMTLPDHWTKHDDDNYEGPYAEHLYGARIYATNYNDGTVRLVDDYGTDQGMFNSLADALDALDAD